MNKHYVDRVFNEVRMREHDISWTLLDVHNDLATVSETVTELCTSAAVPCYVKSNCGLIPVLKASNNKSGFNMTSSSHTEFGVVNIFIGYIANTSWIPNIDSVLGSEAWVKVVCPMSVKIHSIHISGIHTMKQKTVIL